MEYPGCRPEWDRRPADCWWTGAKMTSTLSIADNAKELGTGAMFVGTQKKLPKKERGRMEKRRELYNF